MLDAGTLAAPIVSLIESFGSGLMPANGASALRTSAAALADGDLASAAATDALGTQWQGLAGQSATTTARTTSQRGSQLSQRCNSLANVVDAAAEDIRNGLDELQKLLSSFLSVALKAGPTLGTPAGQIMLVGSATEHLGKALQVVAKVRAALDRHAGELQRGDAKGGDTRPSSTGASRPTGGKGSSSGGAPAENPASTMPSSLGSVPDSVIGALGGAPSGGPAQVLGSPAEAFGGGSVLTLPDGSTAVAPNERAAAAVRAALTQQGVPYVWGGTSPGEGLDCSGLTQWAYREAGLELPRLAQEQGVGSAISMEDVLPGDLAVWDGHVAMIIGNGQMVEAGDPVQIQPIRTSNSGMEFYGFYRPSA